jgi:hypothetical protein
MTIRIVNPEFCWPKKPVISTYRPVREKGVAKAQFLFVSLVLASFTSELDRPDCGGLELLVRRLAVLGVRSQLCEL